MAGKRTEIGLDITANDDASKVIEGVADAVEQLEDGAEVEIDADVGGAERQIDKFAREVEDLTDSGKELRIDFREQTLQAKIRKILRDLEKLDDPQEIRVKQDDLEEASRDLRELQEFAGKDIEVDIRVDEDGNAARAVQNIDGVRQKGEGLQSAIPAIRGFGDELGTTAGNAGIASQAVADLGDFSLIMGERFATSGSKVSALTTKLGTALGAAGLAGAIGGIAVQLGQVLIPKIQEWIGSSDEAIEANEGVADSFDGIGDAIMRGRYREAVDEILTANDELNDSANDLGVGTENLTRYLLGLDDALDAPAGVDRRGEAYRQLVADADAARGAIQSETAQAYQNERVAQSIADDAIVRRQQQLTEEGRYSEALQIAADSAGILADDLGDAGDAGQDAGEDIDYGMSTAERAIKRADDALSILKGTFDLDDAAKRAKEAMLGAMDGSAEATRNAQEAVLNYATQVEGLPEEKSTEIAALIDENKLGEATRIIDDFVNRQRLISIGVRIAGGASGTGDKIGGITEFSGGPSIQAIPTQQNITNNYATNVTAETINRKQRRDSRINGTKLPARF